MKAKQLPKDWFISRKRLRGEHLPGIALGERSCTHGMVCAAMFARKKAE